MKTIVIALTKTQWIAVRDALTVYFDSKGQDLGDYQLFLAHEKISESVKRRRRRQETIF